jgi:hypothetical protein
VKALAASLSRGVSELFHSSIKLSMLGKICFFFGGRRPAEFEPDLIVVCFHFGSSKCAIFPSNQIFFH